ncbi:hypothetical protein ACFE04_027683 [Oxalis oulophora]
MASSSSTSIYVNVSGGSLLTTQKKSVRSASLSLRVRAQDSINMSSITIEKMGIKVERNPPEDKLSTLGVRKWPKWGCPESKFPWTYTSKETCYLLEGKVKVYPDGSDDDFVEIQAGDLVEFPNGMTCTWDVSLAVDKHYKFE